MKLALKNFLIFINKIQLLLIKKLFETINKFHIEGIDIGSVRGSFLFCKNIDQVKNEYISKNTKFPINDRSLKYIYSSHFIEHIDDDTFNNILDEAHRILRNGGILRIVFPDFEKIKRILDNRLFDEMSCFNFKGRPEWQHFGITFSIEKWAAHFFANYQNYPYVQIQKTQIYPKDFYRGPPNLNDDLIKEFSMSNSVEDFSRWLISHIPTEHISNGGHINCYTYDKISKFAQGKFKVSKMNYCDSGLSRLNKIEKYYNNSRKQHSQFFELIKI